MKKTQNHTPHNVGAPKTAPKCKTTPPVYAGKYGLGFELATDKKSKPEVEPLTEQWFIFKLFRKLIHFVLHDLLG